MLQEDKVDQRQFPALWTHVSSGGEKVKKKSQQKSMHIPKRLPPLTSFRANTDNTYVKYSTGLTNSKLTKSKIINLQSQ